MHEYFAKRVAYVGASALLKLQDNSTATVEEVGRGQNYDTGDIGFIAICSCMVLIMIPGLGFLYSGLARRKSALSMIWVTLMSGAVGLFQWYFWGYSLTFSATATNGFIGNLDSFGFRNVLWGHPADTIPELLFATFQGMFCMLTLAIIMGGAAERGRLFPAMVFTFIWATLVYCPLACWAWGPNGWANTWGVLDYAGGGPVEIGSGVGGFGYAIALGRRKDKMLLNFRPHNVSLVTLGTILLWFGWLGFNGGSASGANLRAIYSIFNSNLTAIFGAMTWCLLDFRLERKWSTVAVCSGIISGLVAATPASGVIPLWASVILGIVACTICNFATKIKYIVHVDDSMDTFAEHGVAGIIGLLFNALFGADWVIGLNGVEHEGGWLNHNWKQLYKQFAYICACCGYTLFMTVLIGYAVNYIPGCHLRTSEDGELRGIDDDQIGEFAYDYVEVRRDYLAWAPPTETIAAINPAGASPPNEPIIASLEKSA
ncbi:similar to Saccharomyces cerevisiae YPR138C MEP3 Ammonium permease of high capacity and low affinity [Geotrichum candidum]|uniref:Ammonium transporter n=2 Tax=Geotrichum candidum TaxID=1173061 RepID=A0A0J9XH82_GEOCN|nr:similar to Saccharomyces cerevisiae YPR138C MEP3 Ammonium permease of high capacity and low affinity [Geotrichum candidum]